MHKGKYFIFIYFITVCSCGFFTKKETTDVAKKLITNTLEAKKIKKRIIWVAIAPYHNIDSTTTHLIAHEFMNFYGVKTLILPKAVMSDTLLAWSKTRYNANKILTHLSFIKPGNIAYILAITNDKIAACGDSTHETGVAGLGRTPGHCSVVSTATLHRNVKNENQFTQRLIKACMHEMGHNFGLKHCKKKNKKCLMRDANGTMRTLDEEDVYLCKNCKEKLLNKGFDIKIENDI